MSEMSLAPEIAPSPVIGEGQSYRSATDAVTGVIFRRTPLVWFVAFIAGVLLLGVFVVALTYLFTRGVGIWGIQIPVAWGFAITNFVWWIGIGHAGTLISAFLLLMNQSWRNSINRYAEAMTVFAVACAGLFPILHLGRPWLFYWLFPYPNTMTIQPQFRSPLVFDVFAVSTYATVSILFWYLGLLPDLATMRDRSSGRFGYYCYGLASLGWIGSSRQWTLHRGASLLLAGLATPLVISVHTIVSFDFTISMLPGWHSTIFPPYFVAGAIYSGFAMVLLLGIPLRRLFHLEAFITERHLNNAAKLSLVTAWILAYAYIIEPFTAWYSGDKFEISTTLGRFVGPYWWAYWLTITCNVVLPQALWSSRVRRDTRALMVISAIILYGMWMERYMIIVTSLSRDFMPSSWAYFNGTIWDHLTFWGSVGLFLTLFTLFVRFVPMMPMYELRELVHQKTPETSNA